MNHHGARFEPAGFYVSSLHHFDKNYQKYDDDRLVSYIKHYNSIIK